MANRAILIIPCYNEAERFDHARTSQLLDDASVDLLLVDDGSTDATRAILERAARARPERIRVVGLAANCGKAEAVRQGLHAAIAANAEIVGYLDADLATPVAEMHRLIGILRRSEAHVLIGARVALLGHEIDRSSMRHYLGRIFATLASLSLRMRVYDTQCGAKLFRVSSTLAAAVSEPFLSRWAFDIELLGRMFVGSELAPAIGPELVWEEPLHAWRDVQGSKLSPRAMARTLLDLVRIEADLAARRDRRARRLGAAVVRSSAPTVERERTRAAR